MSQNQDVMGLLREKSPELTKRGRRLADYVLANPGRAVFLRAGELAEQCGVSDSTVVRFVAQLGYSGYKTFIQALRDYLDRETSLLDRVELAELNRPESELLREVVNREIEGLQRLFHSLDREQARRLVEAVHAAPAVFVVGSRLSYAVSYFLAWSLAKLRPRVHCLAGSDTVALDRLTMGPDDGLVIIAATARYPNELIKLARLARRRGQTVAVISDSASCPLNQFADLQLLAAHRHISVVGSLGSLNCLVSYLSVEYINRYGDQVREFQGRLETLYREQDLLFNLERPAAEG
jgi:DNA-binding MurR/RpiR family transcriptional regulator